MADRDELAEFPDLLARLQNARVSFAKLTVEMKGKLDTGRTVDLLFKHDGVEFIVPAEGKTPLMVPGAPLQWSQVLSVDNDPPQPDKKLQRRELDVPAAPRPGGGRTEPQKPNMKGGRDREGAGNLVSGDKTLLENPERGKGAASVSGAKAKGKNGRNKKNRAA